MPTAGLKLLIIGKPIPLPYQTKVVEDSAAIMMTIAQFQPDVIMTTSFIPGVLNMATFELRKRWINVPAETKPEDAMRAVEGCYAYNIWTEHQYQATNPLISVYTPTYNTGDYLRETYQSLKEQTYANWEWIVIDDHSVDGTWERLESLAKDDIRVRPYRSGKRIEKIGAVKDQATRLSKGVYLVELDHDDLLTDFALAEIKAAFEKNPDVGFVYSNSSNFFENGTFHKFTDDFWKDRYRETEYRGKKWTECLTPDIYDRFGPEFHQQFGWFLTVGPNHVRAFRAKTFFELGGYNQELPVADDWDLYARMFLRSKCLHVPKMLYLYRFKDNWSNTTFTRNKSIQDHLQLGRNHYAGEFKAFNDVRLKTDVIVTGGSEILLTIAVPSMPSRMESLYKVIGELFKQSEGKPVEVICLLDNRKSNLSEKRNQAIVNAKGKYISFVDDDDSVEPGYVDAILEAIDKNVDADCIVFNVMVHGYAKQPKVCKYGVEYQHSENDTAYLRKPNHVMAYRTDISKKHKYRKELSAISEDTEWAERACRDIKKQVRVEKVLYHYFYNEKETTQLNAVKGQKTLQDVSYVVLRAADTPLTKRCLESIKKYSAGSEIVLVQNGCAENAEVSALADQVVALDTNVGFAAGCNVGAKAASRSVVCFMNDDAAFVDDTPVKLLSEMSVEYPVVAPYSNRAKFPQGDILKENCPTGSLSVEMVVGLCMMIPKELYEKSGGFDPRLLTYEDDDLCKRLKVLGYGCRVVGGAWVDHERHETFKKLGLDVQGVMFENEKIFKRKNPVIRVIAIAKDEEKSIEAFFQQFHGITRDWCVLDTGSTDKTVELSKSIGCRVESAKFEDFAQARNEAVKRFGAGADWIVMFDPDERLDTHTIEHLQSFLFNAEDDIYFSPLQAVYPDGSRRDFVAKPILWRNKPEIRWVFKVHEKLVGSSSVALIKNAINTHIIELHEDGRRKKAEWFYKGLMDTEPYFTDAAYKKKMIEDWPILDYDRPDDPRIKKVFIGPVVTVVIPTFKRTELLLRAVKSACSQDYPNLDVVIVGDDCPELMELKRDVYLEGLFDRRARVFNLDKNHGAGGAEPRNHAIMAAAGNLIAYLDDDNAWKPGHVSSVYEAKRASGASYAFSSMEVNGTDLKFKEPKQGGIDTSCILHDKSLIQKHGFWKDRVAGGYAHDWEFIGRWVTAGEKWAATGVATLVYNIETCGQRKFLQALALAASKGLVKY